MKLAALMLSSTQILPTPLNENDLNFQLFNKVNRRLHNMLLFNIYNLGIISGYFESI